MKNYLGYKNEIAGFADVGTTVGAVEKIAASHIYTLKKKIEILEDYTAEIQAALGRLSLFYSGKSNPLLRESAVGDKAVVLVSGKKGLVGGLYHKLVEFFLIKSDAYKKIIVVGDKGKQYSKDYGIKYNQFFSDMSDTPDVSEIKKITNYIFEGFVGGDFRQVDLIHLKFISLVEQTPVVTNFLPFDFRYEMEQTSGGAVAEKNYGLPIFDSSAKKVFDVFLKKYIEVFFYKIIAEAKLSEFSARTIAMEDASEKIDKMIENISLDYFKERKRDITQKQLESFSVHKVL